MEETCRRKGVTNSLLIVFMIITISWIGLREIIRNWILWGPVMRNKDKVGTNLKIEVMISPLLCTGHR